MKHECDNCGAQYTDETLNEDIESLEMRITPGGITPSGECTVPDCRALVFPVDEEEKEENFYLLIVWGDVEPVLNPVADYEEAIQLAQENKREHGDDNGLYWLSVKDNKAEVGWFSGGQFDDR